MKYKQNDIIDWIDECKTLRTLKKIRTGLNRRIQELEYPELPNPFAKIPLKRKMEIMKNLLR